MSSRKIKPSKHGVSKTWRQCAFCRREWPKLAVRKVPKKLRLETDAEREETMYRIERYGFLPKDYIYRDAERRAVYICPDCFRRAAKDVAEKSDPHAAKIVEAVAPNREMWNAKDVLHNAPIDETP